MADAAPKTEKKPRKKAEGPRAPRAIHVLLTTGEDGKPTVHTATYNPGKLVKVLSENPGLAYSSVTPEK